MDTTDDGAGPGTGSGTARRPRRWVTLPLGVLALVLLVPLTIFFVATWLSGSRLQVVQTGSMEPTYPRGSLLVVEPVDPSDVRPGQALMFEAIALDPEDGMLSGAALSWSSSLDGLLGTGSPLALAADQLTEGLHVLTLTATDLASNTVQVSLQFRIDQPALLFEDDFESGGLSLWSVAP